MRASEDIQRKGRNRVEFTVDAAIFEDELIEAGVYHESHEFVAYLDYFSRPSVSKVLHLETGEDVTEYFNHGELIADIFFAAMRNENFNGGDSK